MAVPKEFTQLAQRRAWDWPLRLLLLVVLMAVGVDALGQTDPRPGETDPLGKPSRYTLFPDQELLAVLAHDPAMAGLNPEFSFNSFAPSADLTTLTPLGGATNLALDRGAADMRAAAGRILAPDHDQVVYARRIGSSVAVAFLGYTDSTTTLSPLANQLPDSTEVFDIAVGDLDKRADSDGNNHDEVVVCFATTPNYAVRVAVLDYTVPAPALSAPVRPQATTTAQASRRLNPNILPIDAVVSCTLGDFDGDGQNEIAVVGVGGEQTLWVSTFRYRIDETGRRTLQEASTAERGPPPEVIPGFDEQFFAGSVDVTAGDFNGDGRDDLAISCVTAIRGLGFEFTPRVILAGSDRDLKLTFAGQYRRIIWATDGFNAWDRVGAQVVSGLFKFDPGNGFGFDRRQLALVSNHNSRSIEPSQTFVLISILTVSDDLQRVTRIGDETALKYPRFDNTITSHVSVVAGGFSGNGDITNPLWSLAVGTWVVPSIFDLRVLKVGPRGPSVTFTKRYAQPVLPEFGRFPLVAYDADGDSMYLGTPVHFTISNLIRPQ
ncbi:MAG TPA: VCBS repeat-containing protein, partial [Candidatus Binatia bacterium]|nr:VCBS repeat-containing protein [Candidatus Binatia bacterium]